LNYDVFVFHPLLIVHIFFAISLFRIWMKTKSFLFMIPAHILFFHIFLLFIFKLYWFHYLMNNHWFDSLFFLLPWVSILNFLLIFYIILPIYLIFRVLIKGKHFPYNCSNLFFFIVHINFVGMQFLCHCCSNLLILFFSGTALVNI
jgi:hypothetical protein